MNVLGLYLEIDNRNIFRVSEYLRYKNIYVTTIVWSINHKDFIH